MPFASVLTSFRFNDWLAEASVACLQIKKDSNPVCQYFDTASLAQFDSISPTWNLSSRSSKVCRMLSCLASASVSLRPSPVFFDQQSTADVRKLIEMPNLHIPLTRRHAREVVLNLVCMRRSSKGYTNFCKGLHIEILT